jgi:hypothetical protein
MIQIWFGLILRFRLVWKAFSFCLKNKRNKETVLGGYLDLAMFRPVWKTFSFCLKTKETKNNVLGLLGSSD